uniref:4'-phosphopantetheine phosphatase n=1 Tax=Megaselia scalaris TaxID=36166 RepID=T1H6L0_MEGSC
NETLLRLHGFKDPWLKQKQFENTAALERFKDRIDDIDLIEDAKLKWTELIRGVLAGNIFDWGAQAVAEILQNDNKFGLNDALNKIQKRPWLFDDLDMWLKSLMSESHKCALIFVDNSGVDVVLGMLPFARELLKRNTKVILAANSEPSLNDVTYKELLGIVEECKLKCDILKHAFKLLVANGQKGPCLDMRNIPKG